MCNLNYCQNNAYEWAQKLTELLLEMKKPKEGLILSGQYQDPKHVWQKYSQNMEKTKPFTIANDWMVGSRVKREFHARF